MKDVRKMQDKCSFDSVDGAIALTGQVHSVDKEAIGGHRFSVPRSNSLFAKLLVSLNHLLHASG